MALGPVRIPLELVECFNQAETVVFPVYGDGKLTVADHCLQVATALHRDQSATVRLYKRDLVVMALFHDIFVRTELPSKDGHGMKAAQILAGRLHPHVLEVLRIHTRMETALFADDLHDFPISIRGMIASFAEFDKKLMQAGGDQLPLDFFEREGYVTYSALAESPKPWLSPNSTLVWAAPSMWIERTPLLLARRLKLFENRGLAPVELRVADGGPELLAMVEQGQAHVGEIGLFPFAKYAAETPSAERSCCLVGSTFIQQLDHYLVGPPGAKSVMALEGKRVGVLSEGSCDSYLLDSALRSVGLAKDSVEAVPLGAHYGKSGALSLVDGAWLVEPSLSQAQAQGQASILIKASSLFPRFQWGAIVASKILRADEGELTRILGVYEEACHLMHQAVSGAAPHILDELLGIGPDSFEVSREVFHTALLRDMTGWQLSWDRVDFQGVDVCVNIMRELGALPGPLGGEELFDVPRRREVTAPVFSRM